MKNFSHGLYGLFAVLTCCAQEKGLYRENDTMIEGVIKVVDEENKPVQGVELELLFATTLHQMTDENRGDSFTVQKVTNEKGEVTFRENSLGVAVTATKNGYWSTHKSIGRFGDIQNLRKSQIPTENDFWEIRWNPTIILPKKLNPRPMYAGEFRASLPELNTTYAFDLEVNDWVRPHGKGEKKDILFTLEGKVMVSPRQPDSLIKVPKIEYDVTLTVHFPVKGDGIVAVEDPEFPGSEVLLGWVAPSTGYQENLGFRRSTTNRALRNEEIDGYWFRVRTQIDPATGNVIQGHYGKIKGTFEFSFDYIRGKPIGSLVFDYMFSPDTQTSMEFNGKNLLKDGHWPLGTESR